jgi:hypothetical protein
MMANGFKNGRGRRGLGAVCLGSALGWCVAAGGAWSAAAAPVSEGWATEPGGAVSAVAASALGGYAATADLSTDRVEVRDALGGLRRVITREEIASLLGWMDLGTSGDGPGALALSDSGRLLFMAVHDAAPAGDGQGSDAVLRLDTQTGELGVFARLELSAQDEPTHGALLHFRGRLFVGAPGGIRVYRALANDVTGPLLSVVPGTPGQMVTGLAVDRGQDVLYAAWGGTVYRSAPGGASSATPTFTAAGAAADVRGLAFSEHYGGAGGLPGGAGGAGLYIACGPGAGAGSGAGVVRWAPVAMARGLTGWAPAVYLAPSTGEVRAVAALPTGRLLVGLGAGGAVSVRDTTDERMDFWSWAHDEFDQVVTYTRGLIAPDGEAPGWVIDADTMAGLPRFHPASPDAAGWALTVRGVQDAGRGPPGAGAAARAILERYAGRASDGVGPWRNADGIYWHWLDPATGGPKAGWGDSYSTMSTMLLAAGASRAAARWPEDLAIGAAARRIICGVSNWTAYTPLPGGLYLQGTASGPNTASLSSAYNEGIIYLSQAASYGGPLGIVAYLNWRTRSLWPSAAYVAGRPVTGDVAGVFQPAFTSLYAALLLPEVRADPSWQAQALNVRLTAMAWTDDFGPRWATVFSAGTTKPEWGGYHADSITNRPGNVTTFPSLLAMSAGTGAGDVAGGGYLPSAVAAYQAYRTGARQAFRTGATMLYRRSNDDPSYLPNSAGLPDVAIGALGLAEVLLPGVVAGSAWSVLAIPNMVCPCSPADIAGTDASAGPDGRVDNGDFALFITSFFGGCTEGPGSRPCGAADIAGTDATAGDDGVIDNGDFALFITWFFGGGCTGGDE